MNDIETHISCVNDQNKNNICNERYFKKENKAHIMNVHEK